MAKAKNLNIDAAVEAAEEAAKFIDLAASWEVVEHLHYKVNKAAFEAVKAGWKPVLGVIYAEDEDGREWARLWFIKNDIVFFIEDEVNLLCHFLEYNSCPLYDYKGLNTFYLELAAVEAAARAGGSLKPVQALLLPPHHLESLQALQVDEVIEEGDYEE